ncbi:uncharacterized protein [Choristoneura fumiferana]|uniref:uncharacterized protein n=1 Tax=Choristoneura fumiferana TaxID=7141 RepID=UPI003D155683
MMSRARAKRMLDFCHSTDETTRENCTTQSKINKTYYYVGVPHQDEDNEFSSITSSGVPFLTDGRDLITFKNRIRNKTGKRYKNAEDDATEQDGFSAEVSEYLPSQIDGTETTRSPSVNKILNSNQLEDNMDSSNSLITPRDLGFPNRPNIIIPESPEVTGTAQDDDDVNALGISVSTPGLSNMKNSLLSLEINTCSTSRVNSTDDSSLALSSPSSSINNKKNYPSKSNPGRKRKRDPSLWKCNVIKKMKNTGQDFVNSKGKNIKKKEMKPGCGEKCIRNCKKVITEERRKYLFDAFWKMGDHESQLRYIFNYVQKVDKKVEKIIKDGKSRRTCTYKYYLAIEKDDYKASQSNSVQVCKKTFLNTFDISDMWLTTMFKKLDINDVNIAFKDMRGKHTNRPNKVSEEIKESVRTHIRSIPTKESHYVRKKTSKLYFDESLSFPKLYALYVEWMNFHSKTNIASKDQYRLIFNSEFNIDFFQPKKDRCLTCEIHHADTDQTDNNKQIKYAFHLANKTIARFLKDNHKLSAQTSKTIVTACYDFQKVLCTPQSDVSLFYYKRKFSVYNFTIFDIGNTEGFCFIYDETVGKKGPNEICSSLYKFITENVAKGVTDFIFYSDCCGGQNRNRTVFAFYSFICAKFHINITHNFFEVGHSQSEGDSMHALIERKKKNQSIYVPSQWVTLIKCAKSTGKPYNITELSQNKIYD